MPTLSTPWTSRIWQEFHAGNLSRAARDVLLTLRTYRGHGGLICPSHDTLADRANCHPSTVLRALQTARDLGLVRWTERRVRAGWRWLRTSNRYTLTDPETPVTPRLPTNRQTAGGGESEQKKEARERGKPRGTVRAWIRTGGAGGACGAADAGARAVGITCYRRSARRSHTWAPTVRVQAMVLDHGADAGQLRPQPFRVMAKGDVRLLDDLGQIMLIPRLAPQLGTPALQRADLSRGDAESYR
jgi:hypothetical protein